MRPKTTKEVFKISNVQFTNDSDGGIFTVEYQGIYYNLSADRKANEPFINFGIAYELQGDGSDRMDYDAEVKSRFDTMVAAFPGRTWTISRNIINNVEQYDPMYPSIQEVYPPIDTD